VTNQASGGAQTYVAIVGEIVVGYYSLATREVAHEAAPARVTKGMARHPIPVMLLARLATDVTWQGRGLGAALLGYAMRRTLQAADIAGIRALVVHAKDESGDCGQGAWRDVRLQILRKLNAKTKRPPLRRASRCH
jgi:GNAT superfamily N-acetyltransferase